MVEDDERHRVARHRPRALDVDIVAVLEGRAEEDRVGIGLAPVKDKVRGEAGCCETSALRVSDVDLGEGVRGAVLLVVRIDEGLQKM